MHGTEVVTSDDHKAGHVVGEQGDYLIVETGTLRKHKHVLPKTFASPTDGELRATITWDILKEAPEVEGDGTIDESAVAEYYGLAEHYEEPSDLIESAGVAAAEQERPAVREDMRPGGDRYGDAPGTKPPQGD